MRPAARPAIEHHSRQMVRQIEKVEGLAIAGGHVAILINRMRLFDLGQKLDGKAVFAWSAGAMAISERIVLFHHSPPQGYGNTEVLEHGLGLARGLVLFPHARRRLALDDRRESPCSPAALLRRAVWRWPTEPGWRSTTCSGAEGRPRRCAAPG